MMTFARALFISLILGAVLPRAARAENAAWPRQTVARQEFSFNQGWRFYLPPPTPTPPPYLPPSRDLVKEGDFAPGSAAQSVMVGAHTSRFVVLESLSSQNATPFASVAEFWLLDANGTPLPRAGWRALADSEDAGAGDLAANAIDGRRTPNGIRSGKTSRRNSRIASSLTRAA